MKVDFNIIIVVVTTNPKNATALPDVKAQTAQKVITQAKTGAVNQLKVSAVIVKSKLKPQDNDLLCFLNMYAARNYDY